MADDDKTRNAGFVGHLVKDAKSPPETRTLTGWLGDAAEEGDRRLYTNADLSCYIDIPADAILHVEPIRDSQPPDGVCVWVRRDAALKCGGSAASRAAQFLQGEVQQDFASGGFANLRMATQGPIIPINTQLSSCNVSEVAGTCPSLKECQTKPPTAIAPCTQFGHHCPTPATTCTQIGPHCPTSCGADCQSQQVNCTQMGEICLTHPVECTQSGPKCPTLFPEGCPVSQPGPACPTPTPPVCWRPAQVFRAAEPIGPSAFIGCTQTFQCGAPAVDVWPTRYCGGGQQFFRAAAQIPSRACQVQTIWHTTAEWICL
jgi:hypothetical protein